MVALHAEDYSCNEVEERMIVAKAAVQQTVKKCKEAGSVKDREGRSRKRKTARREDRSLVRAALQDRGQTSCSLLMGSKNHIFWIKIVGH